MAVTIARDDTIIVLGCDRTAGNDGRVMTCRDSGWTDYTSQTGAH